MKRFIAFISALFLTYSLPSSIFGQAADGILVGTVTDQGGATVPGATVDLTNIQTGIKSSAKTDSSGQYRFNNVPVGRYKLDVGATGFQAASLQNLAIELNRTATANITLQVGQVATTVEVTEAGATIDTTTANISTSYVSQQATQLPLSGLSGVGIAPLGVINLSLLSAGVTSSGGLGYGTGPSIGGQRPTNNNFMIEGIDNNDRGVTGPQISIPNEAVAEFSLQQNQFSAEFGHSTGGQFNTIVKSGTNEIHGTVFEYFQNKNLNALDQSFARQDIRERQRFDSNRVGGVIGGPIVRNKWFYSGYFQYNPIGQASTAASQVLVPTAEGISMLERIPQISRQNLDVFKQYITPAATPNGEAIMVGGQSIPLGLYQAQAPSFQNFWDYSVNSDYYFSERDQIRARYFYNKQDSIDTSAIVPAFYTPVNVRNHLANLTWFHTFSPNLTSELRLGYNRAVQDFPVGDQVFPGLDSFPNLGFQDLGLDIGPNNSFPQNQRANTFQINENVNWVVGRHTFKFGYDGRKLNSANFFIQRARGDYQYNTFERYLLDITPEFAERSTGGFPFVGNLLSHYAYIQDEWRLRPNLSLTLGVRYEYVGVPEGSKQQSLNSIASVPGLLEFNSPTAQKNNFAPRVGIAWSPGRSGKTSIRAGFGMAYDQIYQNLGTNSLPPQFFTTIDAHINQPNRPNFLGGGAIPNVTIPITDPATARELTSSYIPTLQQRPYSIQWNFGVQHVFFNDYTLEVRYLGSRGIHLPVQHQINRPAAVTGQNSLPLFYQQPTQAQINALPLTVDDVEANAPVDPLVAAGFTTPITAFRPQGNSSYHGLATQITKRFSRGLQFTGAYTWSHNIDDSTAALFSTVTSPRRPEDFNNMTREKMDSALDRRHRLTFAWLWDTPWLKGSDNWAMKNLVGNWTFSGAYTYEVGPWATVRSGVDSNMNGDNAGDRTVINPGGDPNRSSGVTPLCRGGGSCATTDTDRIVGWLVNDPTAFYVQAGQGVATNSGRNTLQLRPINNFDLTVGKNFNFTESKVLQFRAEFYNAFNHPQYTPGYASAANLRNRSDAGTTSLLLAGNPIFNQSDLAFQSNARVIQLVARFQF